MRCLHEEKEKVVIITYNKFPDGDAGAIRLLYFAKMLASAGKTVFVLSMGNSNYNEIVKFEENVYYTSLKKNDNKASKLFSYLLFPLRVFNTMAFTKVDTCIFTEVDLVSTFLLHIISRLRKITLVYDAVEWYSSEQFKKGDKDRSYRKNNNYNTKYIRRPDKVISISSYLHKHFESRGIESIRIPVLCDSNASTLSSPEDDMLYLIYAGSPGKKDYLDAVIRSICLFSDLELSHLKFNIYGCTKKEFLLQNEDLAEELERLEHTISFNGTVCHSEIITAYETADFSILVRSEVQRYARAGFPTKFVESMSLGTPVIANITSDLGNYLVDKKNGILIDSVNIDDIHKSLAFAMSLSKKERYSMKIEAYNTAKNCFDYRLYITRFVEYLR